jgi:predicted Mrr-cat superfamily restriction endonuclease
MFSRWEKLESRLGYGTPRSLSKIDRVTAKVCLPSGSNITVDEQNRMIDALCVDQNVSTINQPPLRNERILRRFNQFCRWAKRGDYVIVGIGKATTFRMKFIARITGDYVFEPNHPLYRHIRKVEIMKIFDEPVLVEKWSQAQRIELIDDNDFIDTVVRVL